MSELTEARRELRFGLVGLAHPIGLTSKRTIDIVLALSGIVLLAPLLFICFVLTIATSPGPALFRHRRVGFKGEHFDCLKFRTMAARGGRGVDGKSQVASRSPSHLHRGNHAQVEPGRTAPIVQRPQG